VPADYVLEISPLDLGHDLRAVSLELQTSEDREPARGPAAATIWSRVLPAVAGDEPWALDFFSHLDRLREFSRRHAIACRDERGRGLVIPAAEPEALAALFERFEAETFGARAGAPLEAGDQELEQELLRRGIDAYEKAFPRYLFCAVCEPESGSLTLLSNRLAAAEVARRVRRALEGLSVEVELPV
jgi:hypothetical protein